MEVESFLLTHPKVKQAQVVGVPDLRLTEVGMAFLELKEGMWATEEEILAFCKGKIANFKIFRYVIFVKEFPLTGSGKTQKFKLKEQARERFGIKAKKMNGSVARGRALSTLLILGSSKGFLFLIQKQFVS